MTTYHCPHCSRGFLLPDIDGSLTCGLCARTAEFGLEGNLVVRYPQVGAMRYGGRGARADVEMLRVTHPDWSLSQIAGEVGVSRQRVAQIVKGRQR